MKKLLACLLVAVMTVTLIPMTAMAAETVTIESHNFFFGVTKYEISGVIRQAYETISMRSEQKDEDDIIQSFDVRVMYIEDGATISSFFHPDDGGAVENSLSWGFWLYTLQNDGNWMGVDMDVRDAWRALFGENDVYTVSNAEMTAVTGSSDWAIAFIHADWDIMEYSEYVFLRVDSSSTPTPPARESRTVNPTASTVLVNGQVTAFEAYNIGGNNFFKLRDLAYALNGSDKQFSVEWDGAANAITLTSGQPYEPVGGEMAQGAGTAMTANPTTSRVFLDGVELNLTAYNIGGNNFFRLRDLMSALDIGVTWDGATSTIGIDTSIGYTD